MMRRTKARTLPIGVISEGTLLPHDLIDSLAWDLRSIRLSRADRSAVARIVRDRNAREDEDEASAEDWQELTEIADRYVPDYSYFGSHDGDGACIGVFPSSELLDNTYDDGAVQRGMVNMGPEESAVPRDRSHFLAVNDHGNATLYRRAGNRWIEVWSIV